jgi:hypothetical protein
VPAPLRLLAALCLLALAGLGAPGLARAGDQTVVLKAGPFRIKPYVASQGILAVPTPGLDGFLTGMKVDIVDSAGRVLDYRDVMLHHVVFANALRRDTLCSTYSGFNGQQINYAPERFFGVGEEGFALSLPEGYGYPVSSSDIWGMVYMLMNHQAQTKTVYVRYTVTVATGRLLTPVTPLWLDERNCRADPIFDVPGTGGPGSSYARTVDVTIPLSGRIVAGGGHLHGGGVSLELSDSTCRTSLFRSLPTWGREEPKPILHEGGPSHMTSFTSADGISVAAGDRLRLTATYDDSLPHTRVMAIMLAYLAQTPVSGCGALPDLQVDLGQPGPPPLAQMPLARPPTGPMRRVSSTVVGDFAFVRNRVLLARGARFTWRFIGPSDHNVTLASGPVGFSSPSLARGRWSYRFTRPGVYRLYCSLHPVSMTQIVRVR